MSRRSEATARSGSAAAASAVTTSSPASRSSMSAAAAVESAKPCLTSRAVMVDSRSVAATSITVVAVNAAAGVETAQQAVAVQGLAKHYGDLVAVDGVDFSVRTGEVFGFLGPNGAGKSTTIKMLCTLAQPTAGTAHV